MQFTIFPEPEKLDQFLLIEPSQEIISANAGFKKLIYNEIGNFDSFSSKSHISLGINATSSELIQRHTSRFTSRLKNVSGFEVHLDGFGNFDNGPKRTIFLCIKNQEPIINIFRLLFLKKRSFTPHITIAKNLTQDQFNKVWPQFGNISYRKSFVCNKITILVRPTVSGNHWTHYVDIPLI